MAENQRDLSRVKGVIKKNFIVDKRDEQPVPIPLRIIRVVPSCNARYREIRFAFAFFSSCFAARKISKSRLVARVVTFTIDENFLLPRFCSNDATNIYDLPTRRWLRSSIPPNRKRSHTDRRGHGRHGLFSLFFFLSFQTRATCHPVMDRLLR